MSSLPRKAGSDVFDPGEVDHGSALIRRLAPDPDPIGSLHFDASDILVVRYLAKLPGATGLNFGVADWVRREMRELDDPDEKGETS